MKIQKIIFLIIVSSIILFVFCQNVFAANVGGAIINPDDYKVDSMDSPANADKLKNIGNSIIGTIRIIATSLSVTVLATLGIKYMVGSAEERADYKKTMMPYVIGAIMVFGITNLLGIVASISVNWLK